MDFTGRLHYQTCGNRLSPNSVGFTHQSWLWGSVQPGKRGGTWPYLPFLIPHLISPILIFPALKGTGVTMAGGCKTISFLWKQSTGNRPSHCGVSHNSGESEANSFQIWDQEQATYTWSYSHFRNQSLSCPNFWQQPSLSSQLVKVVLKSVFNNPYVSNLELRGIHYLQPLRGCDNFWKHIKKWFLYCETISHAMNFGKVYLPQHSDAISPCASERKKKKPAHFIQKEGSQEKRFNIVWSFTLTHCHYCFFSVGKGRLGGMDFSLHSWQALKFLRG